MDVSREVMKLERLAKKVGGRFKLFIIDLIHVLHIKPKEVNDFTCGINFCLVNRL